MKDKTRVAVLITCHNRRATTLDCLDALFANVLPAGIALDVFLTDDGSTDGTEAAVRERFPGVETIKGDGNLYWNRGMHRAFARALEIGFDGYLWLNDDTRLYANAIELLWRTANEIHAQEGHSVIVVGSTQDPVTQELTYGGVLSKSRVRPFRFSLVTPASSPTPCHTMNGNCVFVPREVALSVGNLEPTFAHAMGDTDYGLRAAKAGFKIWVAPGYVGTCALNSAKGTFKDRSLSLRQRWKQMMHPKGLPPLSWLVFTRRHAGLLWPLHFLWPYVSVVLSKQASRCELISVR